MKPAPARRVRRLSGGLLPALLLAALAACSEMPTQLAPSGFAVRAPDPSLSFDQYLQETRSQIQQALDIVYERAGTLPFGEAYPVQRTLEMRSPYEIREAPLCPADAPRTGYLLIHGLTDSPYLLSAVARSLAGRSPCSLVRSVLLPGHGTVPGDSLDIHRDEWRQITQYGVDSFRERVDALYLVGYSAGATLAVEYADRHRDDALLAGLILLSPAMNLPDGTVRFSPYARWFLDWLGPEQERDAAKYETLSINSGAEFYLLVNDLNWPSMRPLELPVFMAVSGADTTVDVNAATGFFCAKAPAERRQLLWYSSASHDFAPLQDCSGMSVRAVMDDSQRVLSISHVGVTMPMTDPHYGLDGGYRQCLHYSASPERFAQCTADDPASLYGERSLLVEGLYEGRVMRRATFNPDFGGMMQQIDCFLSGSCQ